MVIHVVGARPNFMKAAPVYSALAARGIRQCLVHTGQHYDHQMSGVFFQQLNLPAPDYNLEVGSGTHAEQTAQVMLRFGELLQSLSATWVVVYGDVNSTLAAALVAAKMGIPVAHVEAGLRSFDRRMPEEINRLLTDQLADLLLTPSEDANANLLREGIPLAKIQLVGNVMIDSLVKYLPLAEQLKRGPYPHEYALVTLHRPSNVDDEASLRRILKALIDVSWLLPIVFPVHPRTRQKIFQWHGPLVSGSGAIQLVDPLGYIEFLKLQQEARIVITDSGGIQEETTFLGVPCFTLRENTERPITVSLGTNHLIGDDFDRLTKEIENLLREGGKRGQIPPLWDGHAAERIAACLGAA